LSRHVSKHAKRRPRRHRLRQAAAGLVFVSFLLGLTGVVDAAPWNDGPVDSEADDRADDGADALVPAAESPSAAADSAAGSPTPATSTGPSLNERRPASTTRQKVVRYKKPLKRIPPPVYFTFQIGSYNIQGSQHRRNGTGRAATSAGLITSRGVDLVGLQEVQWDQLAVLRNRLAGYDIWPQSALGRQGYRHQIAYRTELFEFVDGGSVTYTFDSQRIPLPYIRLRDRASGGEFYLINTHNSARGLEAQRDSATSIQIGLINQLRETGLPVFIVGDVNEHTEFFCRVSVATGMVAANGGSGAGGCTLPPGPLRVDWIMGGGGVDFSGYVQDGASISSGASDHYFIHSDVTVSAEGPNVRRKS
jgi:endonuclease/exonuclease/phosphatase family metal-dependent hydrolase